MEEIVIQIAPLAHHEGLPLPAYASSFASGMDLHAAVEDPVQISAGRWVLIPTGLRLALPTGVEGQIRPRSGMAVAHGVTVLNAPGTIDADYRGEVKVLLVNLGEIPFLVNRGDRVAQLVFQRVVRGTWRVGGSLSETQRSSGGFGHTGI
jgi:dUTP pyrophosphatase